MPSSSNDTEADPEEASIIGRVQQEWAELLHARDLYIAAKRNLDDHSERYEKVSIDLYNYRRSRKR